MHAWIDTTLVVFVFTTLALLGGTRLVACVRRVALQGAVLGLLSVLLHLEELAPRTIALIAVATIAKTLLFPKLLVRAIREVSSLRESESFVGMSASLAIGFILLAIGLWTGSRLPLDDSVHPLVLPVGMFAVFSGIFLIVARRLALFQVIEYLVLENGIYLLGISLVRKTPLLVEFGVLLDVFLAVLVMGTTIFHMNRELEHVEADRLASLKD